MNKSFKWILSIVEVTLISILVISLSTCTSDEAELPIQEIILPATTTNATKFTIVSNDITVTDTGYEFDGILRAESEDGDEFDVVDGDIVIETDETGNILRIRGRGGPIFPNIGNFEAILRDFDWKDKVWSHIQYETGSWYKTLTSTGGGYTDLPLNDDEKYFHFQVIDYDDGDFYQLKPKVTNAADNVNDAIYTFKDFYLDPNDPSFFFKRIIINAAGILKGVSSNKITKKLMKKIADKAEASNILNYAAPIGVVTPELSFGFSNNGKIMSTSYEFKSNGYFQEFYDFSGFDSRPSHFYSKLKNVPIPYTGIMRYTGDAFIHIPEGRLIPGTNRILPPYDWGKFLGDTGTESLDLTYTGSIDFGGKGIGMILGILPTLQTHKIFRADIFNSDINLDLVGYTEQVAIGDGKTSLNLGIESRLPMLDILDPSITRWFLDQYDPSLQFNNFFYLSIDEDIENWVIHYEEERNYPMGSMGSYNTSGYMSISKDGLLIGGQTTVSRLYGIIECTNAFTGSLSTTGFEITTLVDKEIALDWFDISFADTELTTTIANNENDGPSVKAVGIVNLPFGIADAQTTIEISEQNGFKAEGEFTSNITLLDGTVVDVESGAGFKFNAWHKETGNVTDKGFEFSGYINAPGGIGQVLVGGSIVNGELNLSGEFEGNVNFDGVNLLASNGEIEISSSGGFKISADFALPEELGSASLSGYATNSGFRIEGTVQSGITTGGHQFAFAQSSIVADSESGVQISGEIDLYAFKANISGSIMRSDSTVFALNGNFSYIIPCKLESVIQIKVNQNKVELTGSGTVYRPIFCAQSQWGPSIEFTPNWNAKKIGVCVGNICNEI